MKLIIYPPAHDKTTPFAVRYCFDGVSKVNVDSFTWTMLQMRAFKHDVDFDLMAVCIDTTGGDVVFKAFNNEPFILPLKGFFHVKTDLYYVLRMFLTRKMCEWIYKPSKDFNKIYG